MTKRGFLLGVFFGLITCTYGQSIQDKQFVVQMSIDFEDLQPYFQVDKSKGHGPLVILNNGVVPTNLNLNKFGEPVQFMTEDELFFMSKEADLVFDQFDISALQADVVLKHATEAIRFSLKFEKTGNHWSIKEKRQMQKK